MNAFLLLLILDHWINLLPWSRSDCHNSFMLVYDFALFTLMFDTCTLLVNILALQTPNNLGLSYTALFKIHIWSN